MIMFSHDKDNVDIQEIIVRHIDLKTFQEYSKIRLSMV